MNERPDPVEDADDDWLDAALRRDGEARRAVYLDDAGFTARVVAKLPAPAAALPAWRKPALTLLWAAAGAGIALALPGTATEVMREITRLVLHPVSLAQIAAGVAMLGAATWAAAAYALRQD